jgi:rSAM/selenodomain-associated transferase 2
MRTNQEHFPKVWMREISCYVERDLQGMGVSSKVTISVVIPALEVGEGLRPTLDSIKGCVDDIVVSDGRSSDHTVAYAEQSGATVVVGERGRGQQLRRGAEIATGDWLLFLHADTVLQDGWVDEARQFMAGGGGKAAVFRFALNDLSRWARMIEKGVALRCRLLALPYGDQGLLIRRTLYDSIGGYKAIPLFEDVDIIRRLGRRRLVILNSKAETSSVRYQKGGFLRRPLKNLMLLLFFYLGVSPQKLVRLYK